MRHFSKFQRNDDTPEEVFLIKTVKKGLRQQIVLVGIEPLIFALYTISGFSLK